MGSETPRSDGQSLAASSAERPSVCAISPPVPVRAGPEPSESEAGGGGAPPRFCIGCPERPVFAAMKLVETELGPHHVGRRYPAANV